MFGTRRVADFRCLAAPAPIVKTCTVCECFASCKRVWVHKWTPCAPDSSGSVVRTAVYKCTLQNSTGAQLMVVPDSECPAIPSDTPRVLSCDVTPPANKTPTVWDELQQLRLRQMSAQSIQSKQELELRVPEVQAATARSRAEAAKVRYKA